MFEGAIGPISAAELIAMREDYWGVLRDRITDHNNGKDNGLVAHCMACGGRVFIQSRVKGSQRLPYFAHYRGGDPACPWHHGNTLSPDIARAMQYRGQQESTAHRLMCAKIDEIVRLDSRYIASRVEKYLPPTASDHGRFPDVYVEWQGFPPFAIEFQLSNTFQTEVSQRCIHYERESVPLLWVLYGLDPEYSDVSQSFRDVIRRHRGNAFLLDHEAAKASYESRTLILTCYLRRDGDEYAFDPPRLVRFDELTFPDAGLPFFEDRLIAPVLFHIEARRKPWFIALNCWDKYDTKNDEIRRALYSLPAQAENDYAVVRLVGASFSIMSAAAGKERNYVTGHPNIKAMLNTLLAPNIRHGGLAPYADMLIHLLDRSKARDLLKGSVGEHLKRALATPQVSEHSAEAQALRSLFPEIFDPVTREELAYFGALPEWTRIDD